VPTNDAIKHISSIVKGVSRLKKDQEAILKQFCTIIFERAEKGDVEAQVVLGKFISDFCKNVLIHERRSIVQ
jgi:hypothetical protein